MFVAPAAFLATQVYSPTYSALADSMDSMLIFLPTLLIVISALLLISVPLKNHLSAIGVSPLTTEQVADARSPAFVVSSPNEKGTI